MSNFQNFLPTWSNFGPWLIVLSFVDIILRGLALWRSAQTSQKFWFIALLVVNSLGVLPLIYLLLHRQSQKNVSLMPQNTQTTTDHQLIQAWIEAHGGQPAAVVDPNLDSAQVGLRVDFPGHTDEALLSKARRSRTISWENFFKFFEDEQLAFEYLLTPGKAQLNDAYRFFKRQSKTAATAETVFDPQAFEDAILDGEPEYYTNGDQTKDEQGQVMPVTPQDVAGEEGLGGDTPDLDSDDDTTQAAADAGLLEPEDQKRLKNQD